MTTENKFSYDANGAEVETNPACEINWLRTIGMMDKLNKYQTIVSKYFNLPSYILFEEEFEEASNYFGE